jgi:hypothetical protein
LNGICNRIWLACAALMIAACGTTLPPRYVIEHDLDGYAYRRYQKSLDIEIPVADNAATGHTAAYLQRAGDNVTVITAFVTVYAHAASLAAEVRAGLAHLPGYTVTTDKLAGQYVWLLTSGTQERFCVWPSGAHLVKLGAPAAGAFPEAIVEAYADLYPSELDEHGNARTDAASGGPAKAEPGEASEPTLPASLREGAPR